MRALLPLAIERAAAWGSRKYLGLPVEIANVDLGLLSGRLVIEGLRVGARPDELDAGRAALSPPAIDPQASLLAWDRLRVHFSWRDLLDRTLHVDQLELEGPVLRLEREPDLRIDPLRHARPQAPPAPPEPAEPEASGPPWKLQLDQLTVERPEAHVTDPTRGVALVDFSLQSFGLDDFAVDGPALSLGGVRVEGPVLRVRRDLVFRGAVPAGAAAAPPAAPAEPAPPAAEGPAASYHVDRIDVDRMAFTWITDAGPLDVALSVHASDVSAQPGARFPLEIGLEIADGSLTLRGDTGLVPPSYHGELRWTALPLPLLALAARPDLAAWVKTCRANGALKVDLDVAATDHPNLVIAGETSLDDLSAADPSGEQVAVSWKRLEIAIDEIALTFPAEGEPPPPVRVALEHVKLVDPAVLYSRPAPALDALLAGPPPAPEPDAAAGPSAESAAAPPATAEPAAGEPAPEPAGPGVALRLASLELGTGRFELRDQVVKPPVRSQIRDITLSARDLRFPELSVSDLHLRAGLPSRARLAVDGSLHGDDADVVVSLKSLDLPHFAPYAAAAGAELERGEASLDTKLSRRGPRIRAENALSLHKLGIALEDPSSFEQRFGVPVDLALALLRDPSGDIDLSIPVKLDGSATDVSVGTIVASALRQALTGALAAPLKLAGAAFSGVTSLAGSGATIAPLAATPGSAALTDADAARLADVAKLLEERPSLALKLRGRAGPEDRPELAAEILAETVRAGDDLPEVEDSGFFARRRIRAALEARRPGSEPELSEEDRALYQRYLDAADVPDARYAALARARAGAARARLLAGGDLDGTRVTTGAPAPTGAPGVLLSFTTD